MINNKSNELTQYVPKIEWENDSRQQYIYKKLQDRLNWIENIFEEIVNNAYIKDANEEGILRFEKEFGIIASSDMALEDRKSKLLSILRGRGGVTNILKLKTITNSFECGDIDVITDFKNYKFTLKFISGLGVPPRIKDVKDSIESVTPAHLLVNYEFKYNTVGYIKEFTVGEISRYTVGEVLTEELKHSTITSTVYSVIDENDDYIVDENGDYIVIEDKQFIDVPVYMTDENNDYIVDENNDYIVE